MKLRSLTWILPAALLAFSPPESSAVEPNLAAERAARMARSAKQYRDNLERARATRADLIFDGDSITFRWQEDGREVWLRTFQKMGAIDFGIPGDTTAQLLRRLANGQLDGLNPRLVVLLIGTNDLGHATDEKIADSIAMIVQDYQRRCPDAVILLQGIFPRYTHSWDPLRERIAHINSLISRLGDGQRVIYVDFGDRFLDLDGELGTEMMPDGLHPSARGYEIWAAAIAPIVEHILAGRR